MITFPPLILLYSFSLLIRLYSFAFTHYSPSAPACFEFRWHSGLGSQLNLPFKAPQNHKVQPQFLLQYRRNSPLSDQAISAYPLAHSQSICGSVLPSYPHIKRFALVSTLAATP